MTDFKLNAAGRGLSCKGCGRSNNKLNTFDWLADIPHNDEETDLVEVQFKNTRKGYYHNSNGLELKKGDIVAVEASPGHDIGTVTLTGRLVLLQIKKANIRNESDIKRIYRIAKPVDLEKFEEAKSREHETMIRSRQIAKDLGLEMKIGDVEYQGDGNKAIFYYIADGRVDFRQLIKVLADAFKVRIEMKQIGARQEAGRIGGIGPCGRELCCATWMKNFSSVSTSAARFQDISLNPQKLAGQCAKLKCCMNYEVDSYVEAHKRLPSREITLETKDCEYFFFKADILSGMVTYSSDKNIAANLVTIPARRAFEVLSMNRAGEKPEKLDNSATDITINKPLDLAEQDDLTRFDKRKGSKKKRNKGNKENDVSKKLDENQSENSQIIDGNKSSKNNKQEKNESHDKKMSGNNNRIIPENNNRTPKNKTDRIEKRIKQEKTEQQNKVELDLSQRSERFKSEHQNQSNLQGKDRQNENIKGESTHPKATNSRNHKNNRHQKGNSNNQTIINDGESSN
ncbi:MAG: hypothetical protein IKH95_02485 [Bacteroidaceae bacterium]|nr:hypothetical protein [Bacteroidaceae bacterium]